MNNLYNKIYEAIDNGIQKALIIDNTLTLDISIGWHEKEISTEIIPDEIKTVNLGLPSGLLWSEYNLGAFPGNKIEDWYGDYYAWGETEIKEMYTKQNYMHDKNDVDLSLKDDAAYLTYDIFRMPSKENFEELLDNTTLQWVTDYNDIKGLNGVLLTSVNNGKSIFMPAAGNMFNESNNGIGFFGCIWTATHNERLNNQPYSLFICNDTDIRPIYAHLVEGYCHYGFSIRPVKINK